MAGWRQRLLPAAAHGCHVKKCTMHHERGSRHSLLLVPAPPIAAGAAVPCTRTPTKPPQAPLFCARACTSGLQTAVPSMQLLASMVIRSRSAPPTTSCWSAPPTTIGRNHGKHTAPVLPPQLVMGLLPVGSRWQQMEVQPSTTTSTNAKRVRAWSSSFRQWAQSVAFMIVVHSRHPQAWWRAHLLRCLRQLLVRDRRHDVEGAQRRVVP